MDAPVERFPSSTGRGTASLAALVVALLVVMALADGWHRVDLKLLTGCLFGSVVVLVAFLRPAVWATGDSLVLRSMLSSVVIPLTTIERATVGRVLVVVVGEERHVSPAVTRPRLPLRRLGPAWPTERTIRTTPVADADYVEHRIAQLTEEARRREGVARWSPEQRTRAADVRRHWSLPAVGAFVGSGLLFAVVLLVG